MPLRQFAYSATTPRLWLIALFVVMMLVLGAGKLYLSGNLHPARTHAAQPVLAVAPTQR